MREFKKNNVFKKIIFSWPIIFLLGVLVVFLAVQAGKTYFKARAVALKNAEIQKEIESLDLRKEELKSTLERLETPVGIEEELHKKFRLKKPDEEVLIIVDESKEPAAVSEAKGIKGFFQSASRRIKSFFID